MITSPSSAYFSSKVTSPTNMKAKKKPNKTTLFTEAKENLVGFHCLIH